MCTCTHACTRTCTLTSTLTHRHTGKYTHQHIHTHTHTCMHVCMCTYTIYIYIYQRVQWKEASAASNTVASTHTHTHAHTCRLTQSSPRWVSGPDRPSARPLYIPSSWSSGRSETFITGRAPLGERLGAYHRIWTRAFFLWSHWNDLTGSVACRCCGRIRRRGRWQGGALITAPFF